MPPTSRWSMYSQGSYRQPPQPKRPAKPLKPKPKKKFKKIFVILFAIVIVTGLVYLLFMQPHPLIKKIGDNITGKNAAFDKQKYSISDPNSIWIIVNKQKPLSPLDDAPSNLTIPDIALRSNISDEEKDMRPEAAQALKEMVHEAGGQGINLNLQSGYRSYQFQTDLYNDYVKQQGQAAADSQSARPGYSEHQTGLAADLGSVTKPSCNVEACFADTNESQWLAANAYKYGFIIRYPADKEAVTGYIYEPWHVRYVGTDLSSEMHKQGITTLEEFFGLSAAPNY
ncbi:MAG TPA: M15 family metallopeptidase [Patescibacteria group bacterium]|nr:M15 family metallopeptidase [Patescibacteria group bacterium]